MSGLSYYVKRIDSYGYIYSIDKIVVEYGFYARSIESFSDFMLENLRGFKESCLHYFEKINMTGHSRFYFAKHFVHLDDGLLLYIGNQSEKEHLSHYSSKGLTKSTSRVVTYPVVKLETNPNKHGHKQIFKDVVSFLNSMCTSAYIVKYDLALDIPVPLNDVQVFKTRKRKAVFGDTRYFGCRNKHGYCKIYDKGKEADLDDVLTRVEHTFCTAGRYQANFEAICVKQDSDDLVNVKLTENDMIIYQALDRMRAAGIEYEDILERINYRKRKTIISALSGYRRFVPYEYRQDLIKELLQELGEVFKCDFERDMSLVPDVPVDDNYNPFVDDEELPFE